MNIRNLLMSDFDFLKNRLFSDRKLSEVWEEDFESWHWRWNPSLRHCCSWNLIVELPPIPSAVFGSCYDWLIAICRWSEVESDLQFFDVALTSVSASDFGLRRAFLLVLTHNCLAFSGWYCNWPCISLLLSWLSVFLWNLCFMLSLEDIRAI
jgi:hypothetical protein